MFTPENIKFTIHCITREQTHKRTDILQIWEDLEMTCIQSEWEFKLAYAMDLLLLHVYVHAGLKCLLSLISEICHLSFMHITIDSMEVFRKGPLVDFHFLTFNH